MEEYLLKFEYTDPQNKPPDRDGYETKVLAENARDAQDQAMLMSGFGFPARLISLERTKKNPC